jgi:hypothetical protein
MIYHFALLATAAVVQPLTRAFNGASVCVVVRSYVSQRRALPVFYKSWERNARTLPVRMFVVNTDTGSSSFLNPGKLHRNMAVYMVDHDIKPNRTNYGYDATQVALEAIVGTYPCKAFVITNGDNYYHPEFLQQVAKSSAELTAVEFVSHHFRGGHRNQHIQTQFKCAHIDLGSIVVTDALMKTAMARYPSLFETHNYWVADWAFIERLLALKPTKRIIPEILFIHQ